VFDVGYAIVNGRVSVKAGFRGRTLLRHESPEKFWMAIVIYSGPSVALITVF
jgi:hypothetical protein